MHPKFIPNTTIDGIKIATSKSEVHSITYSTLKECDPNLSFEDLYNIPYDLETISKNKEIKFF